MLLRSTLWTAVLLGYCGAAAAADRCTMIRLPDIQVTMHGLTPMVSSKIDGTEEPLILDSGAAYSMLSLEVAARLNLSHYRANFYVVGATGAMTVPDVAIAKTFAFDQAQLQYVDFTVTPGVFAAGAAGLLGQNVLQLADVEYDLADGVVRLIRPVGCGNRPMAYWATAQNVSVVDLRDTSALHPHLLGRAELNGSSIRILFDTGAPHSIISLHAAKSVGVTPGTPGVTAAGEVSGAGGEPKRVWSATFASVNIGGESILHARVLIGDIEDSEADMVLGADFFLAHRVYVANSQHKLYFTYNGGPVFNLNTATPAPQPAAGPAPAAESAAAAAASSASDMPSNQPTDGEGYMRRAMAYSARHEFASALADLDRACQLAPRDPRVFYQRALLYRHDQQPGLALADLSRAIALDPGDIDARVAHATLSLPNRPAVEADLAAIDHLAGSEDDARLSAAALYGSLEEYAAAAHQYDVWIDSHQADTSAWAIPPQTWAIAFSGRCWTQGAARLNLRRALSDCDRAVDLLPKSAEALDSRALVYLQRGELDHAIADYDAALKLQPRRAGALYGRGLAEMRQGHAASARADLAAAVAIRPAVAQRFASFGLEP